MFVTVIIALPSISEVCFKHRFIKKSRTCNSLPSSVIPDLFRYQSDIFSIQGSWQFDIDNYFTSTAESHGFSPDVLWSGLWSGCRSTKSRRSRSETAKLSGAKGLSVGLHLFVMEWLIEKCLSPSIHKFDDVFIYSGLSTACDELDRAE